MVIIETGVLKKHSRIQFARETLDEKKNKNKN